MTDGPPPPSETLRTTAGTRPRLLLGMGLVLVAFNLRLVFSSLSSVLPELMARLDVTPVGASLLTTMPVVCLGLFAPFAPGLATRLGAERLILGLVVLLAVGTAMRGIVAYPAILVGSLLAGASIAMMNVLLPSLVKRDFPDATALMMGLYSMGLCAGAAAAAGATVPLERLLGGSWSLALAAWAVPVVAAGLLWTAQLGGIAHRGRAAPSLAWLWRDRLAWTITLFMGLQSALAYSIFGWLAPILRERGLDPASAGYAVSLSVTMQVVTSLVAPWAAARGRDQRTVAITLVTLAVMGLLGCLFGPLWSVWSWAAVQGIGQGGLFAVAMTIIILRSPDAGTAAALSGMAQGVGYVMAGLAPLLIGLIRTWTGGFSATAPLFLALGAAAIAAVWGAGRQRIVGAPPSPRERGEVESRFSATG